MKTTFLVILLTVVLALSTEESVAQASIYTCEGDNLYQEISANSITISDDGTTFYCTGDVTTSTIENPDPGSNDDPKPKCGGNTGWVCGVITILVDGDITTVRCVGTSGRCVKVVNPN
jgi:hypothetical protein